MIEPPPLRTEYALSDAYFRALTPAILKRTLPLFLLATGAGWYMAGLSADTAGIVASLVLLGVVTTTVWLNVRRQHRSFRSYRIAIDNTAISRTQDHYPPLIFKHEEIGSVTETPKGIVIAGSGRRLSIAAPATLEHYDAFKAQLAGYHRIESGSVKRQGSIAAIGAGLAAIGAMVVIYRSPNPKLVLLAASAVFITLIYSFVAIQRSPALDRRVKRSAWWLIPLFLSLATVIYSSLQRITQ